MTYIRPLAWTATLTLALVLGSSAEATEVVAPRAPYVTKVAPAPQPKGVRKLLNLGPKNPRRSLSHTLSSEYKHPGGRLYQNGVRETDVGQGRLGDCYFLAAASAVAQQRPNAIRDAFTHHPDGTLSVRLFQRKVDAKGAVHFEPESIHIDRTVPMTGKSPLYAKVPEGRNQRRMEQWPALMEKAFAKSNRSFKRIEGGWPGESLEVLTGQRTSYVPLTPGADHGDLFNTIRNASKDRRPMVTGTFDNDRIKERVALASPQTRTVIEKLGGKPYGKDTGVIGGHAYTILGVSEKNGEKFVHLRNPWGSVSPSKAGYGSGPANPGGNGIFKLPMDTFATLFADVAIGGPPPTPAAPRR